MREALTHMAFLSPATAKPECFAFSVATFVITHSSNNLYTVKSFEVVVVVYHLATSVA